MGGYLGDGYGQYGDHGDDDFRREMREGRDDRFRGGERDQNERFRGAERDRDDRRGFMFDREGGREEQRGRHEDDRGGFLNRAREFFDRDDDRHEQRGPHGRGNWQSWDDGPKWNEQGGDERYLASRRGGEGSDERATRAAEAYRSRYGTQGHEGQYGGGASMDLDRHGGSERWDSDRERRHNFSGVGRFGSGPSSQPGPQGGGLHDHHYRSWRDRQIQELDRDYEEYCREHEQQFGSSFESWRQQRQSGMTSSAGSRDPRSEHQGMSGSRSDAPDSGTGSSLAGAQAGTSGDSALGGSASIAGSTTAGGASDTRGIKPGDVSSSQPGGTGDIAGDASADTLAPGGGTTTSKRSKL